MEENRFATENLTKSLSNYPVAKGDDEGHPFRGNQYTNGIYGEAHKIATAGRSDYVKPQKMKELAGRFKESADRFRAANSQASQSHDAVATHLSRMADGQSYPSASQWSRLHALTEQAGASSSNYPVVKGDLPGHEFHGNQFTSVGSMARASKGVVDKFNKITANRAPNTDEHERAEKMHNALAKAHTGKARSLPLGPERDSHLSAARAHTVAAQKHDVAAMSQLTGSNYADDFSQEAMDASANASQKSSLADLNR